jgi:hypothetical protein
MHTHDTIADTNTTAQLPVDPSPTDPAVENTPTRAVMPRLRSRLLLLVLLLLFIGGSVTWLLWPDVVAALAVTPVSLRSPMLSARKHLAPTPTAVPTLVPTPTLATAWISLAEDTFKRPDQVLWGQATSGTLWGADANTQTAFAIANKMGRITNRTGKHLYIAIIGPAVTNEEITCTFQVTAFRHANVGVVLHYQNATNWVRATLNGTALLISQMENGHFSRLGESPFVPPASGTVTLRFRADDGTLFAQVWITGTPEPTAWMLEISDPSLSSPAGAGEGGIMAVLRGANAVMVTGFVESGEQTTNAIARRERNEI